MRTFIVIILIFACCNYFLKEFAPVYAIIPIQLVFSYLFAFGYEKLLRLIRIK